MLTPTAGLSDLLTGIGVVVTNIVAWATQIVTFIVSKPLLLAFCAISIFGCAVILVKSWIHR